MWPPRLSQEHKISGRTLRKLPVKAKIAKPQLGGRGTRVRGRGENGAGLNGEEGGKRRRQGELVEWVRGMRRAVEVMIEEAKRIQKPVGFGVEEGDE